MAQLQPNIVYQYLKSAGFSPAEAAAFTSIAQRESGFRNDAWNSNNEDSGGLWQINLRAWENQIRTWGWNDPRSALKDPAQAAAIVRRIYVGSGFTPWGPYKGVPWNHNTDPMVGVNASGGEVTVQQVQALPGYNASAGSQGGGGTAATPTQRADGAGAAAVTQPFPLPKGGTIYDIAGVGKVVAYDLGPATVYYIATGNEAAIAQANGLPYGGKITSKQFKDRYQYIANGGSWTELAGQDIQKAGSYQDWMNRQLKILSGGDRAMLQDGQVLRLLLTHAAGDMSDEELEVELKQTRYYQGRTQSQQEWGHLSEAEKEYRQQQAAAELVNQYFSVVGGEIDIDDRRLQNWAMRIASGQASMQQVAIQWLRPIAERNPESPWSRSIREESETQLQRGVDVENTTTQVRELFRRWGVKATDKKYADWAAKIVAKTASEEDLLKSLKTQAAVLYPWKDPEMETGDAAEPWVQTYSRVLERPADMFHVNVQKALAAGQPLYEFEKELKMSDEWLDTTNGRNTLESAASEIGRRMGFVQ